MTNFEIMTLVHQQGFKGFTVNTNGDETNVVVRNQTANFATVRTVTVNRPTGTTIIEISL